MYNVENTPANPQPSNFDMDLNDLTRIGKLLFGEHEHWESKIAQALDLDLVKVLNVSAKDKMKIAQNALAHLHTHKQDLITQTANKVGLIDVEILRLEQALTKIKSETDLMGADECDE